MLISKPSKSWKSLFEKIGRKWRIKYVVFFTFYNSGQMLWLVTFLYGLFVMFLRIWNQHKVLGYYYTQIELIIQVILEVVYTLLAKNEA